MENTSKICDADNDLDELALCRVVYELGRPDSTTISVCLRCYGSYDRCVWRLDEQRRKEVDEKISTSTQRISLDEVR